MYFLYISLKSSSLLTAKCQFGGLAYKSQPVQLLYMFFTGGDQVDAGGFNAGVAQHVRQFHNIPAGPIKSDGEQMPQIVGETLLGSTFVWPHSFFISRQI